MFLVFQKSNMSHWAKIKVLAGLHFFLEALGKSPLCWFFQLLEAVHISWIPKLSSTFKPEMSVKFFHVALIYFQPSVMRKHLMILVPWGKFKILSYFKIFTLITISKPFLKYGHPWEAISLPTTIGPNTNNESTVIVHRSFV